jgi:hypothetical protein
MAKMDILARFHTTYVAHAGENTLATAAYCSAAVLSVEGWHHLPTALAAAGYAVLGSIASRRVGPGKQNGTASFLPTVVAARRSS